MPRRKRTTAMTVMELAPGARLFAYLRDSGGASQERSVIEQRLAIERHVAERSWVVVDWFVDAAVASGNYARRSEFSALIDACRQTPPPVQGVILYSLSRFGRDEYDSQFYRLQLRRNGLQVVSVIDQVPSGPFALIMETFIDWQNREFLDKMSKHVREGLRHNVEAGLAPGGTPPTGYRAEPVEIGKRRDGRPRVAARWVVDEEVAPQVREAFRLAAEGLPFNEIIAQTGLPMKKSSLRSLLTNRTYRGLYKLGPETFPGPEPLVDQETWERVQARFVSRAEHARVARRNMPTPFLLTGLAVCGECGELMDADTDRRNQYSGKSPRPWRSYRCRAHGRIEAEKAEQAVIRLMLEKVLTRETVEAMLARLRELLDDPEVGAQLAELGPKIAAKRRQVNRLLDDLDAGGGDETRLRKNAREAELAALLAEQQRLTDLQGSAHMALSEAQMEAMLGEMRAQVTSEDAGVVRHVLRQWIERVTLWDEGFGVDFQRGDLPAVLRDYIQGNSYMPPRGFGLMPYPYTKLPLAFVRKM